MAFDAPLAERLRQALAHRRDVVEKQMFGGLAFMVANRMTVGVLGDDMIVKVGAEAHDEAVARPYARPMDFTGRPMRGMLYIAPGGTATDAAARAWVTRALAYLETQPPKPAKAPKAKQAPKGKAAAKAKRSSADAAFSGFPKEAMAFLRGIATHNNKAWFQAHQPEYHALYDTGIAFAAALGPQLKRISPKLRFDPRINGSVFRINRDVRFAKDKSPYKNHLDLWFWLGDHKGWDTPGCFFRMLPQRLILGAGMHTFEKDQLERYRRAVVNEKSGKALAALVTKLEKAGYVLAERSRKSVPRGYDPGHPRADLLLLEGLNAGYDGPVPRDVSSPKFVAFCLKHFKAVWPVAEWLSRYVVR
jgi:uncharacterized protein (TIGR02453 family)